MYLQKQSKSVRIITREGNNVYICCKSPKRCVKLAVTLSPRFMFDVCLMSHLRWSFSKNYCWQWMRIFNWKLWWQPMTKKFARCKSIIRVEPWYLMESFYFKDCPFSTTWSAHQKKKKTHSFLIQKLFIFSARQKVNSNECRLNLFGYS